MIRAFPSLAAAARAPARAPWRAPVAAASRASAHRSFPAVRAASTQFRAAQSSTTCPVTRGGRGQTGPVAQPPLIKPSTPPWLLLQAASYGTSARGPPPPPPPPVDMKPDREHEKKLAQEKLQARPGEATTESSGRYLTEEVPPVAETLGSDVNSIKEALSLEAVPRESYALGLAGTIPYFVTSLSTVYLGWTLRQSDPTSSPIWNSFLVSHDTAQQMLQFLEPVQLGYGAMIISFLGAIHWGMEYMEKTPDPARTRFRYALGVLAPAAAWPTLLLPIHFALTGQFLAFTLLYLADARATTLGWAPPWYATYRFVLTLITGSALLISLVFRAKIDDAGENMTARLASGMHQRGQAEEDYGGKWAKLEAEDKEKEKERLKKKKEGKEKSKKTGDGEHEKSDEGQDGDDDSGEDGKDGQGDETEEKEKDGGDNDNSKGDEKKGKVDGDTASKKKEGRGDEEEK